jgi:hypothetical protein
MALDYKKSNMSTEREKREGKQIKAPFRTNVL